MQRIAGLTVCLLGALLASETAGQAEERPPNFVVIFTDDQGYQDVGVYGAEGFQTPNLDRMAAEGMKFTDFYVAAPVCSPSRAALLTGCYPPRVGVTGVYFPRHDRGMSPKEITIAELLKKKGYATKCIGKWHLGHHEKFLPTNQGFDSYYGIPYSNDMSVDTEMAVADGVRFRKGMTLEKFRSHDPKGGWVPLMRNTKVVEYPAEQATLTKRYTQEAVRFIKDHEEQPFFLYLPHTMPHVPLAASEKFRGRTERGLYGDVIEEIDWSVGRILDTLEARGLAEHTLVLFTSDNGPWLGKGKRGGSAGPLRAGKFSTFEGGMRVPFLAWGPGRVPAGTVTHEVAATIDFLPTFADFAGVDLPSDRVIDGKSIRTLLTQKDAESPHDAYYYYRGNNLQAVRSGRWKLHLPRGDHGPRLYNLRKDIREQNNVAEDHAAVVKRLTKKAKRFDRSLKENRRPEGKLK